MVARMVARMRCPKQPLLNKNIKKIVLVQLFFLTEFLYVKKYYHKPVLVVILLLLAVLCGYLMVRRAR